MVVARALLALKASVSNLDELKVARASRLVIFSMSSRRCLEVMADVEDNKSSRPKVRTSCSTLRSSSWMPSTVCKKSLALAALIHAEPARAAA